MEAGQCVVCYVVLPERRKLSHLSEGASSGYIPLLISNQSYAVHSTFADFIWGNAAQNLPRRCPHGARTVPARCPLRCPHGAHWKNTHDRTARYRIDLGQYHAFNPVASSARIPLFLQWAPCGHRAGTVRAPSGHRAGTVGTQQRRGDVASIGKYGPLEIATWFRSGL